MPELTSLWGQSFPLRQLNWLWQMAALWQPLSSEKVISTLLDPTLLRVDHSCLRLLELKFDPPTAPSLAELGQLWRSWNTQLERAAPGGVAQEIVPFLGQLCDQMIHGQIKTPDHLLDLLDQALSHEGQFQIRQVQIATCTDQGPSRQRNEDACYPPGGTSLVVPIRSGEPTRPLVIVCDGIGGHEGGEVASGLAIATLQSQTETLLAGGQLDSATLIHGLERATLAANDAISERNDQEQRHERQRMGTTLVMGLAHAHEFISPTLAIAVPTASRAQAVIR
ncbi:MAG: hypothetical protein HC780_18400 [Leptolyngbyaceae cyanobacterium CSU_1_3]|nr:hypothetical protein [Leptolyngbyaceae cyanobacterium CSU_1_3]